MLNENMIDVPVPLSAAARNDIGGAVVRRPFSFHGKVILAGTLLSEADIRSIPVSNRNALRDNSYIQLYPKAPDNAYKPAGKTSVFVVHRGGGAYDVIEGVKINEEPLSKSDAEALAYPSQEKKVA